MAVANSTFVPVEKSVQNALYLEQYASGVLEWSSRYNNDFSISYSAHNLVDEYSRYPSYGDFSDTYMPRTYGVWWKSSPAYQPPIRYADCDPFGAEEYVTLKYNTAVVPRYIIVYETFNPGAVVRIWGRHSNGKGIWVGLWQGWPQEARPTSRKFCPKLRPVNYLIDELRLELNLREIKYYTALDAVSLCGYRLPADEENPYDLSNLILAHDLLHDCFKIKQVKHTVDDFDNDSSDRFAMLPHELIVRIFHYLDLVTLGRCANVNSRWQRAAYDPTLYRCIMLKSHWHLTESNRLWDHLMSACQENFVRKLDISWARLQSHPSPPSSSCVVLLLRKYGQSLTHLTMNHSAYADDTLLDTALDVCKRLQELRVKAGKITQFERIANFKTLTVLCVPQTRIVEAQLVSILAANPHLRCLNIDLCDAITNLDIVTEAAAQHTPNLISWSSWKVECLTAAGAVHLAKLHQLEELDLGWCLMLRPPGDCLEVIAKSCHRIKRLILSSWRALTANQFTPVLQHMPDLRILDLLGIVGINEWVIEKALAELPHLELLDISYCGKVTSSDVAIWQQHFPHVTIQSDTFHTG